MVQFRLPMLPNSGEVDWNAKVNGVEYSIPIESNAILLDVLRDQAGSLGTKKVATWAHVVAARYLLMESHGYLA